MAVVSHMFFAADMKEAVDKVFGADMAAVQDTAAAAGMEDKVDTADMAEAAVPFPPSLCILHTHNFLSHFVSSGSARWVH